MKKENKLNQGFEKLANAATKWAGSSSAFITALFTIIIWLLTGPIFHYSDTWQLIINTGTTIITFLMVFLIQKSQNKDGLAIQLKLNELVAASTHASNRIVNIEDMTQDELETFHKYYSRMAERAKEQKDVHMSISIDKVEAERAKDDQLKRNKHKKTDS